MQPFYEIKKNINLSRLSWLPAWPPHINDALECTIILKGECTAIGEKERYHLKEGDMIVYFPKQIRGYEDNTVTDWYQIGIPMAPYLQEFYNSLTQMVPVCPHLKKGQWEHSGLPELLALITADQHRKVKAAQRGYSLVIITKLLAILELKPLQLGATNVLNSVIRYINENYKQPITRTQIANAVGYNVSYISRLFSQEIKMSISEYVQSLRVDDARQLLLKTNLPITGIALNLGFGSVRTFNRVFLKMNGVSPKVYRKNRGESSM